ncbi:cytochrome c biogenesis protein CcdA [Paenibacillus sp. IB182496]|uniref:Cytochrome c biogenesis protein CcdA n=1 Tax=Paenibacillus sabuli TaxID=2772509 RepID=A0A927GQR4_9BACL|nr:cytochrome c biogenesis protein CcdA [Paenibacillus sabuli]MBD2844799.1 cytochrome c biogenesis protein CcdA [Paenibacillus sabuli]
MNESVTLGLAFAGGLLAFVSPCTLPLYPSFISYITGISIKELEQSDKKRLARAITLNSLLFLLGFSFIYYVLGYSASLLGNVFYRYQDLIRMLGAVFIGTMGLFLLGIFQPQILMKQFKLNLQTKRRGKLSSVVAGIVFAAGWTPCIGPIFGSIMYASALYPGQTFANVTAYALGFGIPFMLMAYFIGRLRWILKYSDVLMKIGGALLLVIAVLLYLDKITDINIWFQRIVG